MALSNHQSTKFALAADVRCWAYNPPGGLCSANLSAAMKPFCTSVIVSKDAISRMSLKNISGMIDEMLIALARCKQPTLKARASSLLAGCIAAVSLRGMESHEQLRAR